jgi:MoxR-like ATPase
MAKNYKNGRQKKATLETKNEFLALASEEYGDTITSKEVKALCADYNLPTPFWFTQFGTYATDERAVYAVPELFETDGAAASPAKKAKKVAPKKKVALKKVPTLKVKKSDFDADVVVEAKTPVADAAASVRSQNLANLVPAKAKNFVPFGSFKDVHTIINSGMFYPMFITGLSGNGKTFGVEQACAKAKRECIRVNFTIETDEDDLIGGFRLVDGQTVFQKGPVVEAMERGAVLLLDEIDLASSKVMCLQSVLEGKPLFLKKIGEVVHAAEGFTIVATANTKGKGDDAGRFIGTNVLNEAFLERFPITFEQAYPSVSIEKKIIKKELTLLGCADDEFAERLVAWADIIRKTFFDGGVDEIIATRRLTHVAKAFSIFEDRLKAVELCVARFDDETKESFLDLYKKVDADANNPNASDDDSDDADEKGEAKSADSDDYIAF